MLKLTDNRNPELSILYLTQANNSFTTLPHISFPSGPERIWVGSNSLCKDIDRHILAYPGSDMPAESAGLRRLTAEIALARS